MPAPTNNKYKAPFVKPGSSVIFKRGSNEGMKHYPSVVKDVGVDSEDSSITLIILDSRTKKTGVRHVKDPWYKRRPQMMAELGCWEESPHDKRIGSLEKAVTELASQIAGLQPSKKTSS